MVLFLICQVLEFSQAYHNAVQCYKDQRTKVARLKKKIARTEGFREYKKIIDMAKFTEEKIRRLKARSRRLSTRIEQIEPSGWKEFLQVICIQTYCMLSASMFIIIVG